MIIKEKGITDEVFTLYSGVNVGDIVNSIGDMKCKATVNWIKSLDVEIERSTIVGSYLTGMKLAEEFKEFSKVTVIDINPHLNGLLGDGIEFFDDLTKINDADLVVDTTGLGGLSLESIRELVDSDIEIFMVEDPTSDGSDNTILKKNNMWDRLEVANSKHKGILKTAGLNSKTSGTMTLTMEVLRKSLGDILKARGVLYGVAGMNFYEGVLFKEKDCEKFFEFMKEPALIISALQPLSPDDFIEKHLGKIKCAVEDAGI
ncbi:MAG: DUF1188 domain-containing protein [Euryarchaeota archaeon]|nr:DUF1188 domain-containing protein [Euryarchaeota archaeon]